ncbi:MAG TPA: type VI secretion system baseplate subunit TssK [Gammaproteobacteria bacterium]|nr:type VI secretion system baseplate subunit TssK [Gammaproteobacteria bacterium]
MSWRNKVIWSEGTFLHPHHFQQHDRYLESLIDARSGNLQAWGWGIISLNIDTELLALGKFAIRACRGIMPDGTAFDIPADAPPPPPLTIPEELHQQTVFLALPLSRQGMAETDISGDSALLARYRPFELDVSDNVTGHNKTVPLQVGQLQMRLMLDNEERDHFSCLGLARILEIRPDKGVILDDAFIAPCLDCSASPKLKSFITELLGLLKHRSEALVDRVSGIGAGVAEISDFMMLQLVNRVTPLIEHLDKLPRLHPESFYRTTVQLAGELATFTADGRRPPAFPAYQQDDHENSFAAVMDELRRSLTLVLEQNAIAITLEKRNYGIHLATVSDTDLFKQAQFVLAVKANLRQEALQAQFPAQVKIGPSDYIRQMVNSGLPGIGLRLLPVAPRHIPYHAGYTYFELDQSSEYWQGLEKSGAIAVHVSGTFSDLEMALWAIKGST